MMVIKSSYTTVGSTNWKSFQSQYFCGNGCRLWCMDQFVMESNLWWKGVWCWISIKIYQTIDIRHLLLNYYR